MKSAHKGFTLIEITLVMVLIAILLAITTPLVSSVVTRNDVGAAHESLYNGLVRAQQLSKNNYKNSQWRVCIDNSNNQYTITSVPCSEPTTNAEIIKISSSITINSTQTIDIAFKPINGEPDYNNAIIVNLSGGSVSKSILITKDGVIDKLTSTPPLTQTPTPTIVQSGLVLHLDAGNIGSYPGTGTTWTDLSSNGNNGTLMPSVGGPTYSSAGGGSLIFDGGNDFITFASNPLLTDQITVEVWVNLNSTTPNGTAWILGRDGSYRLLYSANSFSWVSSTVNNGWYTPGTNISAPIAATSGIYQVVGTYNGSNIQIYVNGTLRATGNPISGNILTNGSYNLFSSGSENVDYGKGSLYSHRIYNRALTPEEVQQNFNATRGRFGL